MSLAAAEPAASRAAPGGAPAGLPAGLVACPGCWHPPLSPRLRQCGPSLHILQLRLQVRERLVELGDARLQLVHRIVQRLHLPGDGVHLAVDGIALRVQLLLQSVDRRVIWLASSAVCSARCCSTPIRASSVDCSRCTIIQQLLHLGLQFHHLL